MAKNPLLPAKPPASSSAPRPLAASTPGPRPSAGPARTGRRPRTPGSRTGASPGSVTLTRRQLVATLLGAAAAGGLLTWGVTGIVSCAQGPGPTVPEPWASPYDWDNVTALDNGFLLYTKDGRVASEAGVDVSEHDGAIDWPAVRAHGADFALVRVGYRGYGSGAIVGDAYFEENLRGAAEAGLKTGVYFFSQAVSPEEAREEALFTLGEVARTGVALSYPVVFDQEAISDDGARTDSLTNEQLTANALAFCQAVEAAGYEPMIYGNQHDLARLDLEGALRGYPVWYAEYGVREPTGQVDFRIWQYTASGTVGGIPATEGQVDMNIRFLE